ncbi:hypothetical protein FBU30_007434 [Linnemannia zychae]|nr:hypothetical protein FBU30_007434 [Linnemannia zychae]
MDIPNIGQPMLLGELYNARRGQSINASILSEKPPSELVESRGVNLFTTKLIYGENYKKKFDAFDIHGDLRLRILANLVALDTRSKYLMTEKQSSKSVKVSMSYVVQTQFEWLNIQSKTIKKYIDSTTLNDPGSTHVVTGLQWGASVLCSFEHNLEEGENEAEIIDILQSLCNGLKSKLDDGSAQEIKSMPANKEISIQISVLSDIIPKAESTPISIEDTVQLLRRVPDLIQVTNQGKGNVLQYRIEPIERIQAYFGHEGMSSPLINADLIDKIEEVFENIVESRIRLTEISNNILDYSQYIMKSEVQLVKNNLNSFKHDEQAFKRSLSETVQAIQAGNVPVNDLTDLLDGFSDGNCSSVMVDKFIENYRPLIERVYFIRRCQNTNIQVIPRGNQITSVLPSSVTNTTYILAIPKSTNYITIEQNNIWHIFRLMKEDYNDGQTIFMVYDASILPTDLGSSHFTELTILKYCGINRINPSGYRASILRPSIKLSKVEPVSKEERSLAEHALRMPCPLSHGSYCHSGVLKWVCSMCEEVMQYGYNEYIYCSCGKTWLNDCLFRCDAIEHGYQYNGLHSNSIESIQKKIQPGDDEINILLLGETGVGKSTFINAFANYLRYDTLDIAEQMEMMTLIPSSFEIGGTRIFAGEPDKNEKLGSGQSSTQYCRSYVFPLDDDIKIRLIDTPGIGDTRGVKQDRTNFEDILNYISGFDKINGICVLLKPNTARLTTSFRFCIDELLLHLHKSASDNILFTFTNTRSTFYGPGDTVMPLQTYMDELERANSVSIPLEPSTMFFFDNESFRLYAALKQGITFDPKTKEAFGASWAKSAEEARRLIKRITEIRPHKTDETVTLDSARRSIRNLAPALAKINENITIEVKDIKSLKVEAQNNEISATDLRKKLTCYYKDLDPIKLERPRTVCTSTSCTTIYGQTVQYNMHCHDNCNLTNVAINTVNHSALRHCWAMTDHETCRICGCQWQNHMHVMIDYTVVKKEKIDTAVEEKLHEKESKAISLISAISKADERLKALESEKIIIFNSLKIFSAFLLQNSILVQNSAIMDYIDMSVDNQTRVAQVTGDYTIVNSLKAQRDELVAQMELFETTVTNGKAHKDRITPLEINDAKEALRQLKINGQALSLVLDWGRENQIIVSNRETMIMGGYVSRGWHSVKGGLMNTFQGVKKLIFKK